MKKTRVEATDDAELTARIRKKEFVKSLKADIRNALLASGHHIAEGEMMTIDQSGHPADGATGAWLIQENQTAAWGDLSQRNPGWEIFGMGRTAVGKQTAFLQLLTKNIQKKYIENG